MAQPWSPKGSKTREQAKNKGGGEAGNALGERRTQLPPRAPHIPPRWSPIPSSAVSAVLRSFPRLMSVHGLAFAERDSGTGIIRHFHILLSSHRRTPLGESGELAKITELLTVNLWTPTAVASLLNHSASKIPGGGCWPALLLKPSFKLED